LRLSTSLEGRASVSKKKEELFGKIVVPPRVERYEDMGDPKPPKMGKITPTTIEIPVVDDLLEELKKTCATEFDKCWVNCKCLPCQQGKCGGCHVERLRAHPDRELVRQTVAQYRG
jgi:hypothetical protein